MRKLLLVPVILVVFAIPSFAFLHLGVSGGYTYSSLDSMNTYWEKIKADAEAYSTTATADWLAYGHGLSANIDLNFNLDKSVLVGVRTGLQYIFPSKYTGLREIMIDVPPPTLTWVNTETSIDNFLIPIMAGGSYIIEFGDPAVFLLRLDAYAGYGLAYTAQRTTYEGVGPLLSLYQGGGFTADLTGALEYKFLPFLSVSLNGGYRFAKTSGYKAIDSITADIPGYGTYTIPTNDPYDDESGKPVEVDFSGIIIGIGINIRL